MHILSSNRMSSSTNSQQVFQIHTKRIEFTKEYTVSNMISKLHGSFVDISLHSIENKTRLIEARLTEVDIVKTEKARYTL